MSYTGTLYEGDSLIHRMPLRSESPEGDAWNANPWELASPIVRAWEAFLDWIDRSARDARYRQIEGYLSQASDLADLERRQRNLERTRQYF